MGVNAGTIFSEVRIALDKLKQDIGQVEAQFNKFQKGNATTATNVQKKWTDSFKNINLQGVVAVAALTLAVKQAISTFADFEQSLANVQSVARATPDDLKALEEAAIAAGESTRFTATQAADAMYFLASAGLTTKEVIESLDGVLQLAGATQSDLAFTAAAMTATLSQYNLEATESISISNIFAAAITNSQATMEKLATSMRYVGPVANAFNISVEETVGVLQALYDAGLQGSQAGTAMRSILSDLADETGPLISKLSKFGLAFEDVNPAIYSMSEIIGILIEAGVEGTDAMALFGQRAGPAMAALLAAGEEGIENYTKAVTGTNAAAEAYAIQNDTLAGSFDFLKSAMESAQISLVKGMAPAIRPVVDLLTQLVKGFTSLPGPVKLFFGIVAIGIPVVAGLAFVIKSLAVAIGSALGPITLIVGSIGLLAAILSGVNSIFDTFTSTMDALRRTTDDLNEASEELNEINKELSKSTDELNDAERTTLEQRKELIEQNMAYALAEQTRVVVNAKKEVIKLNKELAAQKRLYDSIIENGKATKEEWKAVNGEWGKYTNATKDYLPQLSEKIAKTTAKQENMKSQIEETTMAMVEAVNQGYITVDQIKQHNYILGVQVEYYAESAKALKEKTEAEEAAAIEKARIEEEEEERRKENLAKFNKDKDEREKIEKKYSDKVFEETHNRLEILEKERQETLAKARAVGADLTNIEEYYALERQKIIDEEKENEIEAYDKTADVIKDYQNKLESLYATDQELIDLAWERAIAEIEASEASEEAQNKAIAAINKYYIALKDKSAIDEYTENMKSVFSSIEGFAFSIGGVLSNLFSAIADKRIAELDRQLEAELRAAGVAEETNIERLQRELIAAKEAGDEEAIVEKENAIKKEQITLDFERKKAQIKYDAEMAMWRITLLQAIAEGARAIIVSATSLPWPFNLIPIAATTALTGLQLAAISQAEPVKPSFQTGGIVLGSSTAQDSVSANLTPGELVLTKEQQARLFALANGEGLNKNKKQYMVIQYMLNGRKEAERVVEYINGGQVRIDL